MYQKLLDTFIQVAESGSFARTSEQLYISSVAIMNQMNLLEENVGVKLLERTSLGVSLTAAGRSLYNDALALNKMFEKSLQRARDIAQTEHHIIRIGSSPLRSFNIMMDNWTEIDDGTLPFQIKIIPFSDDNIDLNSALHLLGSDFDCFISPCDIKQWRNQYNTLVLKTLPYRLALSRKHPLAQKGVLSWDNLRGETLMLLRRGIFSSIDALRDTIEQEYPEITIIDIPRSYNMETFNECVKMNYLMGIPGNWTDVHPSLINVPVQWNCDIPYGIIYRKDPSKEMAQFISAIRTTLPE